MVYAAWVVVRRREVVERRTGRVLERCMVGGGSVVSICVVLWGGVCQVYMCMHRLDCTCVFISACSYAVYVPYLYCIDLAPSILK